MAHRGGWHRRGWHPWGSYGYNPWGYGPWWGSERILLVEPDPKPDPCPRGFVLSATTKKCVKGKKEALKGLDGILENPMNLLVLVGVGYLAYKLGKRGS